MARKQGDSESGKLGNKIYYTWHGRQCERSMPTSVANPQTEAQQAHRSNFAMVSKLSSYMKEAHLIGLHWHAIREHNSTYAIFRQLNKDCFTPDGEINLPRVIVSRGSVEQVEITSATIDNGVLTVTFDGHCISILWLYIHFFEMQIVQLFLKLEKYFYNDPVSQIAVTPRRSLVSVSKRD